jgi:hypothetical protein
MTGAERLARYRAAKRAAASAQPEAPPTTPTRGHMRNGGALWLDHPDDRISQVRAAMARAPSPEEEFVRAFCERARKLRLAAKLSQSDVDRALGQRVGNYAKWEKYHLMPVHLMPAFARLVGTDCNFLLTGRALKETR